MISIFFFSKREENFRAKWYETADFDFFSFFFCYFEEKNTWKCISLMQYALWPHTKRLIYTFFFLSFLFFWRAEGKSLSIQLLSDKSSHSKHFYLFVTVVWILVKEFPVVFSNRISFFLYYWKKFWIGCIFFFIFG